MLTFQIKQDGSVFHAWCPELPGCHTQGNTKQEALEYLKEAATLYIESVIDEQIQEITPHNTVQYS